MTDSALPQRMREAAETLRAADARHGGTWSWSPERLEKLAAAWEADARANADRETEVEELARKIYAVGWVEGLHDHAEGFDDHGSAGPLLRVARRLIQSGWRKGES